MKRFAALLMIMLLTSALCLTAYASDSAIKDAVDGVSGQTATDETISPSESSAPVVNGEQEYPGSEAKGDETPTEKPTQEQASETEKPTEPASQTATAAPGQTAGTTGNHTVMIIVIICSAALLILLLIISAVLLRKKKPADGEVHPHHGAGVRGTAVRIEVLSGRCYNANLHFRLRRNLTVGTDSGCDLVFDDPMMMPMHAVISKNNGVTSIAECADSGITYIGGMKIFAPNRLRSGDVVTIGSTAFQIFFE